jgi:hypothetical protein
MVLPLHLCGYKRQHRLIACFHSQLPVLQHRLSGRTGLITNNQLIVGEEITMTDVNEDIQHSAEELLGEAEPWESWESKLLGWSIGIAIVGLVILGWLINTFLLQ